MLIGKTGRTAAVLALFALAACATQRIEKAGQVANAGVAFADAVPAVLDESFVLSVAANSSVLAADQPRLTPAQRETDLTTHDQALKAQLPILHDLKTHARLLRSYFIALGAIVSSDATTGISAATGKIVSELSKAGVDLSKKQVGGFPISDAIQPAIDFAVATYQNAVLSNELRERGHTIERELELQRAALSLIGEQMRADADARIEHELRKPVFTDYVNATPLPSDWTERRIAAFRQTADLDSLNKAVAAAENLHNSWIAFAQDRLDEASLLQLLKDIDELVAMADQMQSKS
jgi:hypothetical protein